MKVKFGAEQKKYITVAELPAVKDMIKSMKEEDMKWDADTLAMFITETGCDILKAEAEIAKNSNVYNFYGDDTGNLDIWVTVHALSNYKGFYIIGAYLSDIWSIGPQDRKDDLQSRMYIRKFIEQ